MSKFILFVLGVSVTFTCLGAVVRQDGKDRRFWDGHAVAVGRIGEVVPGRPGPRISVTLLGVVATDFFIPVDLVLTDVPAGPESALAGQEIKPGEIAVFCVLRTNEHWTLPNSGIDFFPSHSAIQPIEGLQDLRLKKIVKDVQQIRLTTSRATKATSQSSG